MILNLDCSDIFEFNLQCDFEFSLQCDFEFSLQCDFEFIACRVILKLVCSAIMLTQI